MFKRALYLLLAVALSSQVLASARVPIISNPVVIGPYQSMKLPLGRLKNEVDYSMTCQITSSRDDAYIHWDIGFLALSTGSGVLNGQAVRGQGKLSKGENTLVINKVTLFQDDDGHSLSFDNLDNEAKVTIEQCYADPV